MKRIGLDWIERKENTFYKTENTVQYFDSFADDDLRTRQDSSDQFGSYCRMDGKLLTPLSRIRLHRNWVMTEM